MQVLSKGFPEKCQFDKVRGGLKKFLIVRGILAGFCVCKKREF